MKIEHLAVERDFQSAIENVRSVFWNILKWKHIWSPVDSVFVTYDDGYHQEFEMHVKWSGEIRTVRTIRMLTESGNIRFFCPVPPSNMKSQAGQWSFTSTPNGCYVRAERWFVPAFDTESEKEQFISNFKHRLEQILVMVGDSIT